jgi:hypothetical protein
MRRGRSLALAIVISACSGAGAGDGDADRPARAGQPDRPVAEREPAPVGRVVSTVDGAPITVDEVELVARETGLAPRDALRRLQEERALSARATAAGLADDPEVVGAARRASVRALLASRVEGEVGPDDVAADAIAARYEAERARFARPERRRATHVLARLDPGAPPEADAAAQRFARAAIERLEDAPDPVAEAHAIQAETTGRTFAVLAEDLPPLSRTDAVAPEVLGALYAQSAPGVVRDAVRTRFGWHALVLVEIVPPWEAPREEAEATIRAELLAELRARRLDELVREIAARTPVTRDAAAIERLLAADLEASP